MSLKLTQKAADDIAKGLAIGHFTCDYNSAEEFDKFMNHEYDEDVFYEEQEKAGIHEDDMVEWEGTTFWEPFECWPEDSVATEMWSMHDAIMRQLKPYIHEGPEDGHQEK